MVVDGIRSQLLFAPVPNRISPLPLTTLTACRSARGKRLYLQCSTDKDTVIPSKMACLDTSPEGGSATGPSNLACPGLGSLSKLPREIRDMIYAFSLPSPTIVPNSRKTREGGFRSLLCTSHIINAEASSLREIGQRPFNVFISARTGPNCGRGSVNFDNLFRIPVCTSSIMDSFVIVDQQRMEERKIDRVCGMLRNFQHPRHHPKRAPIKINLFVDVPTSVCWSCILLNHMSGLVTSFTSLLSICSEDNGPTLEMGTINLNLTVTPWSFKKTVDFATEALNLTCYSSPQQHARLKHDTDRFPSSPGAPQHPCYLGWSICHVLAPMYFQAYGTTGKKFTARLVTLPSTLYRECGWWRCVWEKIDNTRRWKTKLRLLEIGLDTLADLMEQKLIEQGNGTNEGGEHNRKELWQSMRQVLLNRWVAEAVALDVMTEDDEAQEEAETQQGLERLERYKFMNTAGNDEEVEDLVG